MKNSNFKFLFTTFILFMIFIINVSNDSIFAEKLITNENGILA